MSLVSPSFLKQKARQLKKEKSLSQSQALDEAAKLLGFTNYKNYLNLLEANNKQISPIETILSRISSESDMSKRMDLSFSLIKKYNPKFKDMLAILKLFEKSDMAMQVMCEKINLKDEVRAYLLKDFIEDEGGMIETHSPYYVATDVVLNNLVYRLDDSVLYVEGDYDLKIEFDGEVPEEYKHYPHVSPRAMFGDFEIAVDENKNITIENSSIGWDV